MLFTQNSEIITKGVTESESFAVRTERLFACFDPILTCLADSCSVQIRGISRKSFQLVSTFSMLSYSLLDNAAQSRSSLFLAHSIIITMAICNRIHSRDYSEERYSWYEVVRHFDVFLQSDPMNLPPNLCDYSVLWETFHCVAGRSK